MTQVYKIKLNMSQAHIVDSGIVFKQGDFGIQIEIEVEDFDVTGVTPQIVFRKSIGAVESTSVSVSGNKFTYNLRGTEIDTPGYGICDLKLKNGTSQRISTASFRYFVEADTMDGLNQQANSYSDTIAQIISQYENDAEMIKDDLEVRIEQVESIAEITSSTTNINDPSLNVTGFLSSDGSILTNDSYASYETSNFIPVDPSTVYGVSSFKKTTLLQTNDRKVVLCYDRMLNPITASYTNQTGTGYTITTSSNAAYVRVSSSNDAYVVFQKTSAAVNYVPYTKVVEIPSVTESLEQLDEKIDHIGTFGPGNDNLLDPDKNTTGFLMSDGTLNDAGAYANYSTSEYIPVDASTSYYAETYKISDSTPHIARKIVLEYDEDKAPVSNTYINDNTGYYATFQTSASTKYVRVCYASSDDKARFSKGSSGGSWLAYVEKGTLNDTFSLTSAMETDVQNIIRTGAIFGNKKILNLGDSIAEDRTEARSYAYQFAQTTGAVLTTDYALSGSTLSLTSDQGTRGCIYSQALAAITDHSSEAYDIIMIDGGTNDHNYNRTIGSITGTIGQYTLSDYTATFDESTALGALEAIFKMLRNQYLSAAIVFILPHKNEHTGSDWATLVTGIRNVCEKWSIPIVDVYGCGELNARITAMRTDYTDQGGTHPNTLGINKFYLPLLIETLKGHVN